MELNRKTAPRWLIFFIDLMLVVLAMLVAYLLRFNFKVPDSEINSFWYVFPTVIAIRGIVFYLRRTFAGIIRYTSTGDAQRLFVSVVIGSLMLCVLNAVRYFTADGTYLIPTSIILIEFLVVLFLMLAFRISAMLLYNEIKKPVAFAEKAIIFGAGEAGHIALNTIQRDAGSKIKVIAFIDDNPNKAGNLINGIRIYNTARLDQLLEKHKVERLIIAVLNLRNSRKNDLVEICFKYQTTVQAIPHVRKWINGQLSFRQLRGVQIEDVLGRDEIELSTTKISSFLDAKTVLVTGAAGSIGSELCRQILSYQPAKLVLLDQSETGLYEIENEIIQKFGDNYGAAVIGNVRNAERLNNVFETFKPDIVFHAAAYKHVPLMENNPSEAVYTNVVGTKNLVDLSLKYGISKFVLISTDKAVNPTNVMGASKRIAEMYTQASHGLGKTEFITTRFGNVLDSNGSVIPVFRKQIAQGGPITVTHPRITRYFMTIAEACSLVVEAGASGQGGQIYLFDMGESVKIVDLAKKMVQLSGLTIDRDIQIVFSGLRPGEKIKEELLATEENTLPTHHQKILIAQVRPENKDAINLAIKKMASLYLSQDNDQIVSLMKALVPEFKSNNSKFQKLDLA